MAAKQPPNAVHQKHHANANQQAFKPVFDHAAALALKTPPRHLRQIVQAAEAPKGFCTGGTGLKVMLSTAPLPSHCSHNSTAMPFAGRAKLLASGR
ncbi:hypothetical protein OP500_05745 [Kingella sp. SNUBH-2017]|uniref:hypothetical protein n=1 Tax=Kingella sp. SNUBH-2017 TaxID=2994077 RepID=UPI0023639A20|nr:hypothetical protein [Kingella sp. SNUBH-2017]MDD2182809.1 hypothetical protein [Kingella sp. SNUBH-2017]